MHRFHNKNNPVSDFYLDDENCIQRLVLEYRTHGSIVVGYDFDNTVYDFHKKGETYDRVVELLRKAKELNCYMICTTANEDDEVVLKYLADNNIPCDALNQNPPFFKSKSTKIYCNILLDDRAGLSAAFKHLERTLNIITA